MQKNILLIDDDNALGKLLGDYFHQFQFSLSYAGTPSDGLKQLAGHQFDIIILDVMLPEMDGFETLKAIRKQYTTPVIMLTARGETTDRIVGLELGADDYLAKPFEPRELVARINSIVKRSTQASQTSQIGQYKDIHINFTTGAVHTSDGEVALSTSEFDILSTLAKHPARPLSRDDLFEILKGHDWDAFNRSIDVTISRLRQKLNDDPKKPRFIKTVFGKGYQFIAQE